jgi:hypothetical protein
MAPDMRGSKPPAFNNLYTVILFAAVCVVIATAAMVAVKCYTQYGTLFKIPYPNGA